VVIFSDQRFEARLNDRSTWSAAIAHGRVHDIPEAQLEFRDI